MTLVRSLIFVAWLYGTMALSGAVFAIPALISRRGVFGAMRMWSALTLWGLRTICGARVVIEGLEYLPKGPALIAIKHQAMLDTIIPGCFLDEPAYVLKYELLSAPIFGWYMKRADMIPIRRETQAKALREMLNAARKAAAEKRQIIIFPEGTRQNIGAPPVYKPGVAALYRDLGLPCTPVALNTGLVWPAHGVIRKPGVVTLRILPPIPAGLSRDEFMRELETRIETESEALLPAHLRRKAA
jgi:1-acyl-sn-glycerol-3-phosphate acyltransferase